MENNSTERDKKDFKGLSANNQISFPFCEEEGEAHRSSRRYFCFTEHPGKIFVLQTIQESFLLCTSPCAPEGWGRLFQLPVQGWSSRTGWRCSSPFPDHNTGFTPRSGPNWIELWLAVERKQQTGISPRARGAIPFHSTFVHLSTALYSHHSLGTQLWTRCATNRLSRAIKGRDVIGKNIIYPKRSFLFGEHQGAGLSQPQSEQILRKTPKKWNDFLAWESTETWALS